MNPENYKMRVSHDPENGQYGDCFRCALAFILSLAPEEVPHFMDDEPKKSAEDIWLAVDKWLSNKGLALTHFAFDAHPDEVLDTINRINDGPFYYLLGGTTIRGTQHNVVACRDEIVLDPHPDNVGLSGPCEDGRTWINFIVRRAGDGD